METFEKTIERANAMPAATWHFLKINDATIEIPEGFALYPETKVLGANGDHDAFERAMEAAQATWEANHPVPTAEEIAEREALLAAEADATYGGTAQSPYQVAADAVEESHALVNAFEHGTGVQTADFIRQAAGERIVIQADSGKVVDAQAIVTATPNTVRAAAIDIIANKRSAVNLSIVVDGCETTPDLTSQHGLTATTLRVFADEDARVDIVRTQTLDDGFIDIDDMGLFAGDGARINIRQTVLGGTNTFTGLAGDLRGDSSSVEVDTRYLGHGDQKHDFNYSLRHHGTKSHCDLNANGVLAGRSSKTLRGTIDLVRGCKGAEGIEHETVLLVDENVRNKTVPVILCNEDDVAGNHGATIGHIREEQLFYLASRGLSRAAAEAMFVSAALEQAAIDAPDDAARAGVMRLGLQIAPGFGNLIERP